ncbi:MAG TPA: carboxypeptidase-like regulatory domain-containing protein [Gemmatimonadaceae bacterium]|jgi:hypothetical protein|nr:carboxypeptidase-like regulatory domain-containing protein [Gemmatimonadaceae bacterium]
MSDHSTPLRDVWTAVVVFAVLTAAPRPGIAQQPPTPPPGRIIGFVSDSAGTPVPAAEILILGAPTVTTDSLGNFVVRVVRSGRVLVRIRKLGFAPKALATTVAPGKTTSVPVVLTRFVQQLDTVVATGRSNGVDMPDYHGIHKFDLFYQRRAQSLGGQFFTHSDIERRFPPKLSDLLHGTARRLPRCQNTIMSGSDSGGAGAIYQLFIDGVPYGHAGPQFATLDAIPPSLVEGMAVYTSPTQLPIEAMGNGCAAIFIWTRSVVTDSG